mgnify:CR=1 FL=1
MRITIVNGWHDDNKGDSAITLGTLRVLKKRFPDARYALVSTFTEHDAFFERAYRHILSRIPKIEIYGSPVPFSFIRSTSLLCKYGDAMHVLLRMLKSGLQLATGLNRNSGARIIRVSDLVISKGGHFLYGHQACPIRWARLFEQAYPLLLAKKYRRPYVILGHSLGPFVGKVNVYLARHILGEALHIFVREPLSYTEALQLGISEERLSIIPDLAFAISPNFSEKVRQLLIDLGLSSTKFCVFTVRQWGSTDESKRFLNEIECLIQRLLRERIVEAVVIVAQTCGPTPRENDAFPSRTLFQRLSKNGRVYLVDSDVDLSPEELAAFYSTAHFVVGTRFHSIILSALTGTPVYAISYFGPKARGIMQMLGSENFCQDINDFKCDKAFRDIKTMLSMRENIVFDLKSKVDSLRSKIEQKIDYLHNLVIREGI